MRFLARWGRDVDGEVKSVVTDISTEGCFVLSDEPVGEGDLVKLTVELPGRGSMTIWGNVVYVAGRRGFGLRFYAFSRGGDKDTLRKILGEADVP